MNKTKTIESLKQAFENQKREEKIKALKEKIWFNNEPKQISHITSDLYQCQCLDIIYADRIPFCSICHSKEIA